MTARAGPSLSALLLAVGAAGLGLLLVGLLAVHPPPTRTAPRPAMPLHSTTMPEDLDRPAP